MEVRLPARRVIRHVFPVVGMSIDITGICTLDELQLDANFMRDVERGIFDIIYAAGSTDVYADAGIGGGGGGGSGDVNGPASSTDNAIVRWDGTGGINVQNSGVTVDDAGNVILASTRTVDGVDVSALPGTISTAQSTADSAGTAAAAAQLDVDTHEALTNNPHSVTAAQTGAVPTTRNIATSNGVLGGGTLATDLTLSLDYGEAGDISTIQPDAAAAAGILDEIARADHTHAIVAAAVVDVGTANAEGASTSFARADHVHNTPFSTVNAALAAANASVSVNSQRITNVTDPASAQDAATRNYVDAISSGFDFKGAVRAATTANITLSGAQTIDGVSVIANDRVLVKNQSTGADNGLYLCVTGAWTRTTDADASSEVTAGMFAMVEEGTVNADTAWVLTTNNPITLGVTSLTFALYPAASGGGGDNVSVNGVAASDADFDDATPAAPAGGINVLWQKDSGTPNNISAYVADATTGARGIVRLTNHLGGTAAAPTVIGLQETGSPTSLTYGAIATGQYLQRSGANVVGAAAFANPMTTSQDIIVGGASGAAGRLAIGNVGQRLANVGGSVTWAHTINPSTEVVIYDDFWSVSGGIAAIGWTVTASGGGASAAHSTVAPDTNHVGVVLLLTGTTTTGRTAQGLAATQWVLGAGETYCEWIIRADAANSDGTDRYVWRIGMHDGAGGGAPTDGIFFTYSDNINSGQWRAVTSQGGTSTNLDSAVAITITTWYKLAFRLNAAATSVEFFINNTSIGSTTTNIPSGATQFTGVTAIVEKSLGTNTRGVFLDSVYVNKTVTRP